MNENIAEKVVVITGASSGLGEAAARHLAALGAKVVLAARRRDRIDAVAADIVASGGQALAVATDVTSVTDMQDLVNKAIVTFGKVDVFVNNAGVMPLSLVEKLKVNEWDQMIDVNLKGVLYGVAAVLPHMQERKSGHIINTASVAGYKLFPTAAVYCATKFAVRALTDGMRQELTPYNIRTTLISPGAVKTELLEHISDPDVQGANQDFVGKVGLSPDSYARVIAFAISQPEDVDINEIVFRPSAQEL